MIITGNGRTTTSALQMPYGLRYEAWIDLGRNIARISSASSWWLGDWLIYGQRAYGKKYEVALKETNFDYQTLRNYAWVARRIPVSRRRDRLSFAHHAEVASMSEEEQELWLGRAQDLGWSRNELRRQLAADGGRRRRTPGLESADEASHDVTLTITVSSATERRWKDAAAVAGSDLSSWIVSTTDHAADSVLIPVDDNPEADGGRFSSKRDLRARRRRHMLPAPPIAEVAVS